MIPIRCVLAFSVLLLSSCVVEETVESGPMTDHPVRVELGKAERANIELVMGAGEMIVSSGADDLVDGRFTYNSPQLEPEVHSSTTGVHESVTISQRETHHFGGKIRSTWDLKLNKTVQIELTVKCGAGKAGLTLGGIRLRQLDVSMGAGQVDLDLRGKPLQDYEVSVSGGLGQAIVHLPSGVGIQAEAQGGLGSISVTGLEKRGDHYENDLYDKAKVNIRLKVKGGIGNIQIIG